MGKFRRILRNQFKGHTFKPNPLAQDKDLASGINWYVDTAGHIMQRPGVQLVATFSEPADATGNAVTQEVGETGQLVSTTAQGMVGMFQYVNTVSAGIWSGDYASTVTGATASAASSAEATYDANVARAPKELYVVSRASAHRVMPVIVSIDYSPGHLYTVEWASGVLYIRIKTDLDTQTVSQAISPTFTLASLHSLLPSPKRAATDTFSQSGKLAQTLFITDGIRNTSSGAHIYAHIVDEVPTAYPLGSGTITARKALLYPQLLSVDDTPIYPVNQNGNVYWAGRSAPLMKFNGFRTSLAGVPDIQARGTTISAASYASGSNLAEGTYGYKITYCVYDPAGGIWESTPFEFEVDVVTGASSITFNVPVEQAAGAYLTRGAKYSSSDGKWAHYMSGAYYASGSDVYTANGTLISGSASEFRIGETVGWWDPTTAARRTSKVTDNGVSGVSLNFEPHSPPTDGRKFDVGATTRIYRTAADGTIYYLVKEQPFIDVESSYTDDLTDATLITRDSYIDTDYVRGAPPRVTGHMCVHQSRLVTTTRQLSNEINDPGLQNAPASFDTVAWSEASSEYFPPENAITLPQQDADIVGVASFDDILYILTKTGVWSVSGNLGSALEYTVSRINGAAGCLSTGSIQVLPEGVMYLSTQGFTYLGSRQTTADGRTLDVAPQLPTTVDGFDRGFKQPYDSTSTVTRPIVDASCARSAVLPEKRWYTCFVPTMYRKDIFGTNSYPYIDMRRDEEVVSGTVYGTEAAKVYPSHFNFFTSESTGADQAGGYFCVYDYDNDRWYMWSGIDASGGMVAHNGELYGCNLKPGAHIWKLSDAWPADYATSGSTWTPITFSYTTAWEDVDDPGLFKVFPRVQVFSLKEDAETGNMHVYVDRDWEETSTVNATISLGSTSKTQFVPLTNEKCRAIRLRFKSVTGITKIHSISGWVIEAAGDFDNMADD